MLKHANDSPLYRTDLPKLVGSHKKASLPSYTRRLSSTFMELKVIQLANGCIFRWYGNILDVYVLILPTISKCKRIPRFFWEWLHVRKQSIPGRLSPPTRPGYEAIQYPTIFWIYSSNELIVWYCVLHVAAWSELPLHCSESVIQSMYTHQMNGGE